MLIATVATVGAASVLPFTAHAATTTTTTAPSTTVPPTTTVPPSPYSVSFTPCTAPGARPAPAAPCGVEPAQVQLSYNSAPPAAVQVTWSSTGRPAQAPHPAATSTSLLWADGTSCGTARCWPWPVQMTDSSWILNGTYQVTVCDNYTQDTCQSASPATSIGVAAPSGPATHVQAAASGNQVIVTWKPPAADPPDLAGYAVTRAGHTIYSCTTAVGPSSVPCPANLEAVDHPGPGTFTYSVTAIRLGAQPNAQGEVSAPPAATTPVAVSGYLTPPGTGGGNAGARPVFIPSPVIGGEGAVAPGGSAAQGNQGNQGPTLGPSDESGGASEAGAPANLQYPADSPVVGKPSMAVDVQEARPATDVVPAGMLALGLLALAIAAHFLYLRGELGRIEARLAESRGERD